MRVCLCVCVLGHACVSLFAIPVIILLLVPKFRHQFVNNELIVKSGLVDKRKVTTIKYHMFLYTLPLGTVLKEKTVNIN